MKQTVYFGVIENRNDPLELGRCQVRIVGLHTHDKNQLPSKDLPWCATLQPSISAAMNGIGYAPLGLVEGTSVVVAFLDDNMQQGLVLGAIGGIATSPVPIDYDDSGPISSLGTSKGSVELRTVATSQLGLDGNVLEFYDPVSGRTDLTDELEPNMRVSGYGIDYGTTIVSIDSGTTITISSIVRNFGENIVRFDPPLDNTDAVISSTSRDSSTLTPGAGKVAPMLIPEFPSIPTEFGDLGDGEKSSQTKDGGVRLSGSDGTFVWDANGNEIEYVTPSFNGLYQTHNVLDGTFYVSYTYNGLALSQKYDKVGNPIGGENTIQYQLGDTNVKSLGSFSIKNIKENDEIPTLPPLPEFKETQTKASAGIEAIISACDIVTIDTKEAKCAFLSIIGGESGWIPKQEEYVFSPVRLKQKFPWATEEEAQQYAYANENNISREEFFSWAYGPTRRGANFLGNVTDEEAGKYHSRGFLEIIGHAAYKKYNSYVQVFDPNLDILSNPDIIMTDLNAAALLAVVIIADKITEHQNLNLHPDFFIGLRKLVGKQTPDSFADKQRYYEYFYGRTSKSTAAKDSGAILPNLDEKYFNRPGQSPQAIQTGSFSLGFRDPNNKYPLNPYLGESDINRLARGIIDNTIVETKDANRRVDIPKANKQGTWSQPQSVYSAKYPFNKVFETESGHIQEFDDTPGFERIHTYHRSGTFSEIDPLGTQVNYITGDNFIIMERNGCISVSGECNITVQGNTNIFAQSDANVEVANNAKVTVGNNLDIGVANDVTMAVGHNFALKVDGEFNIDAGNIKVKSQENTFIESVKDFSSKAVNTNIHSTSESNFLSGFKTHMDYSEGQFGNGAAEGKTVENNNVLKAPMPGVLRDLKISYLIPPLREFEEDGVIETPDDWETPEGRSQLFYQKLYDGSSEIVEAEADEKARVITGGISDVVEIDHSQIDNTLEFTDDFMLSPNFSLGMLVSGGIGGRHKLKPQMLQPNIKSPERLYTIQEIVGNMAELSNNTLERIIEVLPDGMDGYNKLWQITSGYRLKGVVPNESAISSHCKGNAVDIALTIPEQRIQTFEIIQQIEKRIIYDELILEYRFPDKVWIHISYRKDNNRKMAYTMVNDKTYNRNKLGLPNGFYLISKIPPRAKNI